MQSEVAARSVDDIRDGVLADLGLGAKNVVDVAGRGSGDAGYGEVVGVADEAVVKLSANQGRFGVADLRQRADRVAGTERDELRQVGVAGGAGGDGAGSVDGEVDVGELAAEGGLGLFAGRRQGR